MRDIAGGRFSSTRCTNPLSPRYVTSASAIPGALVPRPIAQSAAARSASSLGHLEEAGAGREQQDQLPARAETRVGFHGEDSRTALSSHGRKTLIMYGKVDGSHAGWRRKFDKKPTQDRDFNLRTSDIPGNSIFPDSAFWTATGGNWCKTGRPRRGIRNGCYSASPHLAPRTPHPMHGARYQRGTRVRHKHPSCCAGIDVADIEGTQPVLKKDTMWRTMGRTSDPVDPVYVPLDGMAKQGLLERELTSKPINVRKSLQAAYSQDPAMCVAEQLQDRNMLDERALSLALSSGDAAQTVCARRRPSARCRCFCHCPY